MSHNDMLNDAFGRPISVGDVIAWADKKPTVQFNPETHNLAYAIVMEERQGKHGTFLSVMKIDKYSHLQKALASTNHYVISDKVKLYPIRSPHLTIIVDLDDMPQGEDLKQGMAQMLTIREMGAKAFLELLKDG